jgi:uncharacterized membrane protein YdfJ with MMPL/SSD domain
MLTALSDRVGSRPRRSLVALLAFVVVAAVLGGPVAGALQEDGGFLPPDSGSVRAIERIQAASGTQAGPGLVLLVDTPGGADSPAARARVAALRAELAKAPGVASVATAQTTRDPAFVSRDGRATFLAVTLASDADEPAIADAVVARLEGEADVTVGGPLLSNMQLSDRIGADLARAELLAFPLLLLLSLLFFRGRATLLPLVVGVTTVFGTFIALRAINELYGLSIFALNLVIGLGIGLAIDYTLFLVTRYREELERHGPLPAAVHATMQTAGRTVAFSAVTVAIALITLTLFPLNFAKSMGIAGAVVALVAGTAALVIAPILFALWGSKLAIHRRRPRATAAGRGWYRLSHAVMRRPVLVAVATTAVMLVAASPALRAEFTPVDASVIPLGESSRTVADRLQSEFPRQGTSPVTIVLDAPRGDAAGVRSYAAGLRDLPGVAAVADPRPLDGSTWQVDVAAPGDPQGRAARSVVAAVREGDAPYPLLVGGSAAEFVDQQAAIASRLPLAAAVLALMTFGVLWLMTGSLILPAKALVMNALTVATALGAITLIYQDGRFEGLLNYTSNGGIEPTDFLVTSALVFALSTDYGVFLLGRIKEARESGLPEREAVAVGVERTGAVVTAAAILLAVAIGAFSTSSISFIQQIGIATAAGVLLDAFVVRALLVPSLMALLGRWNWWAPSWLRRVHARIPIAEGPLPARAG